MVSNLLRRLPTTALFIFATSLALIATVGCVSSSRFDTAIAERNQLAREKAVLAEQLEDSNADVEILAYRVENQEETLKHVRQTYGQLVDDLETEVVAGAIEVEMMKNGVNLRISEEVLFNSGSADLGEKGIEVIRQLAQQLKTTPYQIVVAGHSDNTAIGGDLAKSYPTNWDLAGARSSHVVDVLEASGISSPQLVSVSYGETRPLASNDTAEGRAANRRIEVRIRPFDVESELETPDVAAPPPSN
jgi:chemotaxis protein MotB